MINSKKFYWDSNKWELVQVETPSDTHINIPVPALFILAPLMGALMVVFLPCIGFIVLSDSIIKRFITNPIKGVVHGKENHAKAHATHGFK